MRDLAEQPPPEHDSAWLPPSPSLADVYLKAVLGRVELYSAGVGRYPSTSVSLSLSPPSA